MRLTEHLKRAIFAMVLLFGSTSVTFVAGQSLGWWQLSASEVFAVFAMAGALAIAILLFVPAIDAVERWKQERPELYWSVQLVAFVLFGILMFVAGEWVVGKRGP